MIEVAEMQARLQGTSDMKQTIDELNESVWEMSRNDPKQGIPLCALIQEWSRNCNYPQGVAKALRNRALCHQRLSNYELALKDLNEAAKQFKELGDASGEASAMNTSGQIYMDIAEYAKAMECFEQAMSLYEQSNNAIGIAATLSSIGSVSATSGEQELALDYFKRSLKMYRNINEKRGQAAVLVSIGKVYSILGAQTESLKCFTESIKLYETTSDEQGKAVVMRFTGETYASLGEEMEALSYFEKSISIMREVGDKKGEASVLLALANLYLSSSSVAQHQQKIKSYLSDALRIADSIKAKALSYEVHRAFAEMYESLRDFEQALIHHKEFHSAKERLIGEEARKKFRNQQIAHAIEKSEKEAEIYRLKNEELSEANRALKELNDLKTEIMGFAAHDLKAPLQSIMTFSELITATSDDKEAVEEFSRNIFNASERMFNMVKSVLQSTAVDLGKIELNKHIANVSTLLETIATQNLAKAEMKEQQLSLDIAENLLANIDTERITEVFENLISNAIKYTPAGKHISVSLKKVPSQSDDSKSTIRASVKDEGQGLTEDDMKKLFGRFQKLSAQPTGGEHSSGLGLYITKKYIELMDGKIWAESEGKDKGATFFVELPSV